jgi:hypothetical protein
MGLFDSIFSTFDNAISNVLGSDQPGPYMGGSNPVGTPVYSVDSQPYSFPQPVYQNTMATVPTVVGGGVMIARGLAQRFPQLWSSIIALSQQFGKKFTPEMLWRMLKENGPGMVVGLIGAAAMNELMVWRSTNKRRRMNPANAKALRRSMRRLKGFDRLSARVNRQLHRGRGVSRRRCGTCRKSPCSC